MEDILKKNTWQGWFFYLDFFIVAISPSLGHVMGMLLIENNHI